MSDVRINQQSLPRQNVETAPTPEEVVDAIETVAEADPALSANDILDDDNVTPAELDAALDSAPSASDPSASGLLAPVAARRAAAVLRRVHGSTVTM